MKTIYKYPLDIEVWQQVKIHSDAKFLSIQLQNGIPCMWFEVDTKEEQEYKDIKIYGTGHELADNPGKYLGTFQYNAFVGHVFMEER